MSFSISIELFYILVNFDILFGIFFDLYASKYHKLTRRYAFYLSYVWRNCNNWNCCFYMSDVLNVSRPSNVACCWLHLYRHTYIKKFNVFRYMIRTYELKTFNGVNFFKICHSINLNFCYLSIDYFANTL